MNKDNMIQSIEHLKNSPLFAISLSGKELSHSNFWAWLIQQKGLQDRNPYIEAFMPGFYGNGLKFISVHREKNNMDLSIRYEDSTGKKSTCVIENKIKSIPEHSQLNRYKAILEKQGEFGGGILTGLYETLDLNCTQGWCFLGYDEIAKRILEIWKNTMQMQYSEIIKQYADDILQLSNLMKYKMESSENKYLHEDAELDQIRFSDIFIKVKGSEFIKKINEKLDVFGNSFKDVNHWQKPRAEFSFNHKKPTITVVYKEFESLIDSKKECGRLGVQIEGSAFRIYGGGSKFGIHTEKEVLQKMMDADYLKEDFQKYLREHTGLQTGMKKKYCKYSGEEYCHTYQYWDIAHCDYDLLIGKILEQLEIAKEIIERGFTFKE